MTRILNFFASQSAQECELFKKREMILLKEKSDIKIKLEKEKNRSFFLKQSQTESWTRERIELQERLTRLQASNVSLQVIFLINPSKN